VSVEVRSCIFCGTICSKPGCVFRLRLGDAIAAVELLSVRCLFVDTLVLQNTFYVFDDTANSPAYDRRRDAMRASSLLWIRYEDSRQHNLVAGKPHMAKVLSSYNVSGSG